MKGRFRIEIDAGKSVAAALAVAALAFAPGAFSQGLDGSRNVVCAAVNVVACAEGPDCVQGLAKNFDLPEFMFVDFGAKVVRATSESPHKNVCSPPAAHPAE